MRNCRFARELSFWPRRMSPSESENVAFWRQDCRLAPRVTLGAALGAALRLRFIPGPREEAILAESRAQAIGRLPPHPDRTRRLADPADIGKRAQEDPGLECCPVVAWIGKGGLVGAGSA